MAAITTTGTLTAGNSRTFALAPGSALTLTLLPNCRVTVTETPETVSASDAGGNSPRTHNHQLAGVFTYGPYAMGGSVVVANASNSGSTVTWGRKDTVVTTSSDGTSLVSGDGTLLPYLSPRPFQTPYYWASFGDSRANTNSSSPDVSGNTQSLSIVKSSWWAAALRGDSEFVLNYGVSGDPASGWALATRNGGITTKPFSALVAATFDILHDQNGVNDILTGNGTTPTAATIAGYKQAYILEAFKAGKIVISESILPCTAAGWVSAGSGTAAQKQAIADEVNRLMQAWCALFPTVCRYVDTATLLKSSSTGYANSAYYVDEMHLNNDGARLCGKQLALASLQIVPGKPGIWYPSGLQTGPNFIDMVAPGVTNILTGLAGTFTLNSQTTGISADGPYTEWVVTPATLSSGEATFWTVLHADVGAYGGATPKYTVAANDVLQGQCALLVDDGAGGTPSGLRNVLVRQRVFYQAGGSTYADVGSYAIPSTQSLFTEKIDALMTTPRITTTTASSGIEATTNAKGYGLHIFVSVSQTGTPIRIRATAPSLRKAA